MTTSRMIRLASSFQFEQMRTEPSDYQLNEQPSNCISHNGQSVHYSNKARDGSKRKQKVKVTQPQSSDASKGSKSQYNSKSSKISVLSIQDKFGLPSEEHKEHLQVSLKHNLRGLSVTKISIKKDRIRAQNKAQSNSDDSKIQNEPPINDIATDNLHLKSSASRRQKSKNSPVKIYLAKTPTPKWLQRQRKPLSSHGCLRQVDKGVVKPGKTKQQNIGSENKESSTVAQIQIENILLGVGPEPQNPEKEENRQIN